MEFEVQFNSFKIFIERVSRRYSAATGVPKEEFISALNEEFFLKYHKYNSDNGTFTAYMRVVLTQRALRVGNRKEKRFYDSIERTSLVDEGEESLDIINEIADEFNLEEFIVQKEKTDADKLQLINALTQTADSITTAIVREYLLTTDAKPTAIGKKLGIHHETVKRKLKYLSRNYCPKKFGELDAYLSVSV